MALQIILCLLPRFLRLPRGVRYFVPIDAYELYCGKVSTFKEGRRYKKHITFFVLETIGPAVL